SVAAVRVASPASRTRLVPMKVSSDCASGTITSLDVAVYDGACRLSDQIAAEIAISVTTVTSGHHRMISRIVTEVGLLLVMSVLRKHGEQDHLNELLDRRGSASCSAWMPWLRSVTSPVANAQP